MKGNDWLLVMLMFLLTTTFTMLGRWLSTRINLKKKEKKPDKTKPTKPTDKK